MLKKQLSNHKNYHIFLKNTILLMYQFNNISSTNWRFLKHELKKELCSAHADSRSSQYNLKINTLTTSNKITEKSINEILTQSQKSMQGLLHKEQFVKNYANINIKSSSYSLLTSSKKNKKNKLQNLFQGPTFLVGCNTLDQLVHINQVLKSYSSNFLFIGGLFKNQQITNYTLEKIVKLCDLTEMEKYHLLYLLKSKSSFMLFLKKIINDFRLAKPLKMWYSDSALLT